MEAYQLSRKETANIRKRTEDAELPILLSKAYKNKKKNINKQQNYVVTYFRLTASSHRFTFLD